MFKNYLAAALRNLARNRLYAAINILGLAIAFAAVMVIALFVRNELTFDRFIPDAPHTYLLVTGAAPAGKLRVNFALSPPDFAGWIRLDLPQVAQVARAQASWVGVRHGPVELAEHFFWADPNLFSVLRLPAVHGDLSTALQRPGSVVLTQSKARVYFGRDDVVGQTLQFDRKYMMTVTAVLKDFPPETHLEPNADQANAEIFASAGTPQSGLLYADTHPGCSECGLLHQWPSAYTYLRLRPGAAISDVEAAISAGFARHKQGQTHEADGAHFFFNLVDLPSLHLRPDINGGMASRSSPPCCWP